VVGREGGDELACVLRDFLIRLGVLLLTDTSTSQVHSLVELHGRGDQKLEAEITSGDEAEDGSTSVKELGRSHHCRFLVVPLQETNHGIADELEALHFLEVVLDDGDEQDSSALSASSTRAADICSSSTWSQMLTATPWRHLGSNKRSSLSSSQTDAWRRSTMIVLNTGSVNVRRTRHLIPGQGQRSQPCSLSRGWRSRLAQNIAQ
jgi:hypothetical protein